MGAASSCMCSSESQSAELIDQAREMEIYNPTLATEFWKAAAEETIDGRIGCALWLSTGCRVDQRDYPEAVRQLTQAVAEGSDIARFLLANLYRKGLGVDKSIEHANQLLKEAADNGYHKAEAAYAEILWKGIDAPQDLPAAATYARRAARIGEAERGEFTALLLYSRMCLDGVIDSDCENELKTCADAGLVEARVLYAKYLLSKDRKEEALKYAQMAAQDNNSDAKYICARIFYDEKNMSQFGEYVKEAAEAGNSDAMALLAYALIFGEGMTVDYEKAKKLCTDAIKHDNALASFLYAKMLHDGLGFPSPDLEQAFHYFEIAANLGHPRAMAIVSACLTNGEGCPVNLEKALEWAARAASRGDVMGKTMAGLVLLETGDPVQGVRHLQEAAVNGFAQASLKLFQVYRDGTDGVEQDEAKADHYRKLVLESGDKDLIAIVEKND